MLKGRQLEKDEAELSAEEEDQKKEQLAEAARKVTAPLPLRPFPPLAAGPPPGPRAAKRATFPAASPRLLGGERRP